MAILDEVVYFFQEEPVWRGQLVSALTACTGIFITLLGDLHPSGSLPLFLCTMGYFTIAIFIFCRYYYDGCGENGNAAANLNVDSTESSLSKLVNGKWRNPAWLYAMMAVVDLEANFCVTTAYKYTSITSIMLLDCFTIPCVMVLSRVFLRASYKQRHFVGTALALFGLCCIIIKDTAGSDGFDHAVLGDILTLGGVSLYAVSNVMQERVMKQDDAGGREEYLLVMCTMAGVLGLVQGFVVEYNDARNAPWNDRMWGYIIGFVLVQTGFYLNVSRLLRGSDAALFNLSLLTSDVYAVIFSFLFTGSLVHWLYFIAFFFVAIGIYVYHSEEAPTEVSDEMAVERLSDLNLNPSGGIGDRNSSGLSDLKRKDVKDVNTTMKVNDDNNIYTTMLPSHLTSNPLVVEYHDDDGYSRDRASTIASDEHLMGETVI